ncbi:glutamine synthetase family protein [Rhizobium alvei]|uniref:Glutamine synthetase family protein n=1 Tax=Rhizobium alvei TaxID=1132659 RepID=A0ABT8YNW2_9HYPH|nr:glutamine synthetase family protein [Rhizobium alvei]MDO6965342.1 glutamine synthetase family protein [Rhizobium alvei]
MLEQNTAAATSAFALPPRIEILLVDMNGRLRGKQIPPDAESKIWKGAVRLPASTQSLDIWGDDNDDLTGISLTLGDPDGAVMPDRNTLVAMPWAPSGSSQVLATMHNLDGTRHFCDPRGMLKALLERFDRLGLTPVVATELEFYVMDGKSRETGIPMPPAPLTSMGRPNGFQLYEMDASDRMEDYLQTVRGFAAAMNLPADATTSEFGAGQFEINLNHKADALAAADDCTYLKRAVEQAARRFGLISTCMAKPYSDQAGSGMHVHASLIDKNGNNVLDAKGGEPTLLKSVTAGMLKTMREAQLVFAPYANSYRRFQPASFAPIHVDWGYGNRGTAIRIPEKDGPGARVEHRVAGADANPYFLLIAILGGMLLGLEETLDPGPETTPSSGPENPERLTHDFLTAVEAFAASDFIGDIFGRQYQKLFADTKRKEALTFLRTVTDFDYRTYLARI